MDICHLDEEAKVFEAALLRLGEEAKLPLDGRLAERFRLYYRELLRWNRRTNLTRITRPEEAAVKHFLDSAAALPELEGARRVLDVGSGAGFPGLVLAMLVGSAEFVLLDASRKRVEFMRHIARMLDVGNVAVLHGRWPEDAPERPFDVVVSRATFSGDDVWIEGRNRFEPGGRLILWKGGSAGDDIPGFIVEVKTVELPGLDNPRRLLICSLE